MRGIAIGRWGSIAIFALAAAASAATSVQIDAERDAVARGLEAQYQAALIRERRLADDRETRLIADAEAQLRKARTRVDEANTASLQDRRSLQSARDDYARLVADVASRDARSKAEIEAYRSEAKVLATSATPEKLAALQRFADGDRVGAWPVLQDLTEASVRARMAAAGAAAGAEMRELARLRGIMRNNGEATTEEVLSIWDRAAALDPHDLKCISREDDSPSISGISSGRRRRWISRVSRQPGTARKASR